MTSLVASVRDACSSRRRRAKACDTHASEHHDHDGAARSRRTVYAARAAGPAGRPCGGPAAAAGGRGGAGRGGGQGPGGAATMLPAHCRVAAMLKPSSDSHIEMEVWMPAENWNGKFQAVGNGGWAGTISYPGDGARRCRKATRPRRTTPVTRAATRSLPSTIRRSSSTSPIAPCTR